MEETEIPLEELPHHSIHFIVRPSLGVSPSAVLRRDSPRRSVFFTKKNFARFCKLAPSAFSLFTSHSCSLYVNVTVPHQCPYCKAPQTVYSTTDALCGLSPGMHRDPLIFIAECVRCNRMRHRRFPNSLAGHFVSGCVAFDRSGAPCAGVD